MTLLYQAVEQKKLDTRVVERNIVRNLVKLEDVKKVTDSLPDDGENAEYVSIETLAQTDEPSSSS